MFVVYVTSYKIVIWYFMLQYSCQNIQSTLLCDMLNHPDIDLVYYNVVMDNISGEGASDASVQTCQSPENTV